MPSDSSSSSSFQLTSVFAEDDKLWIHGLLPFTDASEAPEANATGRIVVGDMLRPFDVCGVGGVAKAAGLRGFEFIALLAEKADVVPPNAVLNWAGNRYSIDLSDLSGSDFEGLRDAVASSTDRTGSVIGIFDGGDAGLAAVALDENPNAKWAAATVFGSVTSVARRIQLHNGEGRALPGYFFRLGNQIRTLRSGVHLWFGQNVHVLRMPAQPAENLDLVKSTREASIRRPAPAAADLEAARMAVNQPVPAATLPRHEDKSAQAPIPSHVEGAIREENGLGVVYGWAADAGGFKFSLDTGTEIIGPLRVTLTERPDVTEHLERTGHAVDSDRHGFMAAFVVPPSTHRSLKLKLSRGAQSSEIEFNCEIATDMITLPSLVLGFQGGSEYRAARALAELELERPRLRPARFTCHEIVAGAAAPALSLIVPFYADDSYLLDHTSMQARAARSDVEWIFVSDDQRLHGRMHDMLRSRNSQLCSPTKLVQLSRNSGYAAANNAGFRVATGRYIGLVNSDVYWRDFSAWQRAIDLLDENKRLGCVGFQLRFEDETIQHDGLTFRPHAAWAGLHVATHPRKGLPATSSEAEREALAVTGAAMVVRRNVAIDGTTLLDPAYGSGDFEDADLCMRVREKGYSISLLAEPGMYHLERQSLRHLGGSSARRAATMANCSLFNRRWASTLYSLETPN